MKEIVNSYHSLKKFNLLLRRSVMSKALEKEFQYYIDHQDELVEKYNGRVIVIKDGRVIGDYDTELEAVKATREKHELGTFLVQKCEPGSESYTQRFHSRVAFS